MAQRQGADPVAGAILTQGWLQRIRVMRRRIRSSPARQYDVRLCHIERWDQPPFRGEEPTYLRGSGGFRSCWQETGSVRVDR